MTIGLALLFAFLALLQLAVCRFGVDVSVPLTSTVWASTFSGSDFTTDFAVVHAVFYNNTLNTQALNNLGTLWKSGISDISLFAYYCMPTSAYAQSRSGGCPSAQNQTNTLLNYLSSKNVYFRTYDYNATYNSHTHSRYEALNRTGYSYNPLSPAYNTSLTDRVTLQTLYINVEDHSPNLFFSTQHVENVLFLADVVSYLESLGIEVGIYTTHRDWKLVMTDQKSTPSQMPRTVYHVSATNYRVLNPFARLKLWTARFDGLATLDNTPTFFDWPIVFMKQRSGSTPDLRRTGTSRICLDFITDNTTQLIVNAAG